MLKNCILCICSFILVFAVRADAGPEAGGALPDLKSAAVVVSRQIRPFIDVSRGMIDLLEKESGISADIHYLDRIQETAGDEVPEKFTNGTYALLVAIGPEAARFVWKIESHPFTNKLYAAVLNPGKNISSLDENHCGISLNIPIDQQVEMIRRGLPEVRRIGIIYDPQHNEAFFEAVRQSALQSGIEFVPLRVADRKNISDVIDSGIDTIDALWVIPDATVISETIIHYLIKACLVKKKSVIGYNRFFYESGAALSFVFDYYQLGRQAGQMTAELLYRGSCGRETPRFEVWLNKRIFRRLELDLPQHPPASIRIKK